MKLSTALSTTLQFLVISPALAGLEAFGVITPQGTLGYAITVDNNETTCNSNWGWRIDQDDHYSLECLPGYVYAFTLNGATSWYSNGVLSWELQQATQTDGSGADWWDTKNFF